MNNLNLSDDKKHSKLPYIAPVVLLIIGLIYNAFSSMGDLKPELETRTNFFVEDFAKDSTINHSRSLSPTRKVIDWLPEFYRIHNELEEKVGKFIHAHTTISHLDRSFVGEKGDFTSNYCGAYNNLNTCIEMQGSYKEKIFKVHSFNFDFNFDDNETNLLISHILFKDSITK